MILKMFYLFLFGLNRHFGLIRMFILYLGLYLLKRILPEENENSFIYTMKKGR